MATKKIRELRFPLSGVIRRQGYWESSVADRTPGHPYPTPWTVNCRPEDPFEKRLRGGSRPTLSFGSGTVLITPVVVTGNSVQVYNAATAAMVSVSPSAGSLPAAFTFGALYRGRLLLAGTGNGVYCSRQGDMTDWDYGGHVSDSGRPTIVQLAEVGEIGPAATALIPYRDAHLLTASAGSLWSLHGDPATGTFRNLSRDIGCVGAGAWSRMGDTIFFLSAEGLYSCGPEGGDLQPLSHEKTPDELRGSAATSLLAYHHDERGLYIFTPGGNYHWFYDLVHGGFWPMTTGIVPNQAAITEGGLVMAQNGVPIVTGGVESFTSHVLIGPLRLSDPDRMGLVSKFRGTVAAGSGDVTWSIVPGNSAEQAVQDAILAIAGTSGLVAHTGTFHPGVSCSIYPRCRAGWIVLWLLATSAWAYESMFIETIDAGSWR